MTIRTRCTMRVTGLSSLVFLLSACGTLSGLQDGAPKQPRDVSQIPDATPRPEPLSKYGNPPSYVVNGKRYYTRDKSGGYVERGVASWYGTKFHGRRTSSGEPYDMYGMTAAHRTLPLPTYARVTNLENGHSVVVKINDRGPFHDNRIIDLSYAAAIKLGVTAKGTASVEVRAIDPRDGDIPDGRPAGVFVQVGAYRNLDNAERLRTRLAQADITGIRVFHAPEQQVYRVRIGPVANNEAAQQLTAKLNALGINESTIVTE